MALSRRIVLVAASVWLLTTGVALATTAPPPPPASTLVTLENPLGANTTPTILLARIFDNGLLILEVLLPIVIVIGAFQMMFSMGNPEEFSKGKKTIVYAAIGFAIVLMAQGITAIIRSILTTPTTP